MKYNQPPGMPADAPYIDGNRSAGTKGSVVPAAALEYPQRELINLIAFAGLTPDNGDLEQVRKAIAAMIAAATGGGSTSDYLLVSQARARLPIFPEILTSDGRMNVTSPGAGSVLVPESVAFQHRGIFPASTSDYTSGERTLATAANKTYHLRWNPTDGFVLKDLADAAYNATAAAETNTAFDSTYDDMLVARVVTNSSNVAAITSLANKDRLRKVIEQPMGPIVMSGGGGSQINSYPINFARTPDAYLAGYSASVNLNDQVIERAKVSATRYDMSIDAWGYSLPDARPNYIVPQVTALAVC